MTKDARLDLGRYISNPFNRRGGVTKRLDFNDLFKSKAADGEYPWNPSRFTSRDLLKRSMTRKTTLNPELNFVGNSPFFDENRSSTRDYEVFDGIGRFNRPFDYDFEEGRPRTKQRPEQQPDFNQEWLEAYNISPTLNPAENASNPMPRMRNPDPKGYLMAEASNAVKSEEEGDASIAELLARQKKVVTEQTQATEEVQGDKAVKESKDSPDKIETKD